MRQLSDSRFRSLPLIALIITATLLPTAGHGQDCWDYPPYFPESVTVGTIHEARGVCLAGSRALVADGAAGLVVVDISDPAHPVVENSLDTPGWAMAVVTDGTHAYVADRSSGIQIVRLSDLMIVGNLDTNGESFDLVLAGSILFVADGVSGLKAIDVSDPALPILLDGTALADETQGIALVDDLAVMACRNSGVYVVDVSDPGALQVLGSMPTAERAFGVAASGTYAYVGADTDDLLIVDISDPSEPVTIRSVSLDGPARGVAVEGTTAVVACRNGGLHEIDVTDPPAATYQRTIELYSEDAILVAGVAYVAGGADGLHIIPMSPTQVPPIPGELEWPTAIAEIDLVDSIVYACTNNDFLCIDVSNPQEPQLLGSTNDDYSSVHNIHVEGQFAYVANNDLRIFDITDPSHPILASEFPITWTAVDVDVRGRYAYVVEEDYQPFQVIDVLDPYHPVYVDGFNFGFVARDIDIEGDHAFLACYYAGLRIVDLTNATAPEYVGVLQVGGYSQNLQVVGDLVFLAAGDAGLKIIDVSDPTAPVLLGSVSIPDGAYSVRVAHPYAYVATDVSGHIVNVDVSDPTQPDVLSLSGIPGHASHIVDTGNYVIVAAASAGLQVLWKQCETITGEPMANGGAETGDLSGWSASGAEIAAVTEQVQTFGTVYPQEGSYFFTFADVPGGHAELSQTGQLNYLRQSTLSVTGYVQTENLESGDDWGSVELRALDDEQHVVASSTGGPMITASGVWEPFAVDLVIPNGSGATDWEVVLTGDREVGDYINVFYDGVAVVSNPTAMVDDVPAAASPVLRNLPNPFNPRTTVAFRLDREQPIELAVFDLTGRRLDLLASGRHAAGEHAVVWDGRDDRGRALSSGTYLVRLRMETSAVSLKVMLLR